jgi:F0F1-type ATP synthase membrane subunit b/b'
VLEIILESIQMKLFGLTTFLMLADAGALAEYLPLIGKALSLVVFLIVLIYVLRRPISQAFRDRRESIRRELMRAQEERNAALAKLEEVEGRLARLDSEVEAIRAQAQKDAAEERARIERQTEEEIRKISQQSQREIESAAKTARAGLRAFAAEQSVRLAEEMIRRDIRPEDDARLLSEYVEELGGMRN